MSPWPFNMGMAGPHKNKPARMPRRNDMDDDFEDDFSRDDDFADDDF